LKTLLEMAQTGTEIQVWIEVRLGNISDDGTKRTHLVVGYPRTRALAPTIGSHVRTSLGRSGGVSVVVLQHTALAFAALNWACSNEVFRCRRDQLVVQALMVSFCVIVVREILNGGTQVFLAEDHHPIQTFGFYREDKSFCKGIQVGITNSTS
jgi:hypothetical protein